MNTLFISTYNNLITIALLKNGKQINLKQVLSVQSHSVFLMPTIKDVLSESALSIKKINEIIVINGPGSFTGLRLGITVAKTLAYTMAIPIKTITSIDALAISNNILESKIVATGDKKGFYYGVYENNKLTGEISYLSNDDFLEKFKNNLIINDDFLDINKIYHYLKEKEGLNPHAVNPSYIKIIEVYNDK